jgi:hypothetical protein
MICYLNGFDEAKEKLEEAKPFLNLSSHLFYPLKKQCEF